MQQEVELKDYVPRIMDVLNGLPTNMVFKVL
jgi:hypothetical protein